MGGCQGQGWVKWVKRVKRYTLSEVYTYKINKLWGGNAQHG